MRRAATALVIVLLCGVSAEGAARLFWRLEFGIPIRRPSATLWAVYPELRALELEERNTGEESFDILLLGGSVLHRDFGAVEQSLLEQLALAGHHNVRIVNLAIPAHTSRDSLLKYRALDSLRFDLVVFYHGINDARVNNVPPDVFRPNYAHYAWYDAANTLAAHHGRASFALPYTLQYLSRTFSRSGRYLPPGELRPEWIHYGADVRSVASFRKHLAGIVDLAEQRGARVLVMTFASHIPDEYSAAAFRQERLDYVLHEESAVEIWGAPAHVERAIARHNDVVREIVDARDDVLLVDQAVLMADVPDAFNDVCHLTVSGSEAFAQHIAEVIGAQLR